MQRDAVGELVLLDIAPRDRERARRKGRPRRSARWERRGRRGWRANRRRCRGRARSRSSSGSPISDAVADEAVNSNSPMKLRGTIDALVDIERHALDVGAVEQVGGGLARGDARVDQRQQPRAFARASARASRNGSSASIGRWSPSRTRRPLRRRRGRAVAIGESGVAKAADGVAQPVARSGEAFEPLVGFRHVDPLRSAPSAAPRMIERVATHPGRGRASLAPCGRPPLRLAAICDNEIMQKYDLASIEDKPPECGAATVLAKPQTTPTRRSRAVFAFPHEALARLAVQVLRVGFVRTFDRFGRAGACVLGRAVGPGCRVSRRIQGVRGAREQNAKRCRPSQTFDSHLQSHPVVIGRPPLAPLIGGAPGNSTRTLRRVGTAAAMVAPKQDGAQFDGERRACVDSPECHLALRLPHAPPVHRRHSSTNFRNSGSPSSWRSRWPSRPSDRRRWPRTSLQRKPNAGRAGAGWSCRPFPASRPGARPTRASASSGRAIARRSSG